MNVDWYNLIRYIICKCDPVAFMRIRICLRPIRPRHKILNG